MSYSYKDSGPTAHSEQAARFTTNPNATAATTNASAVPTSSTSWDQVVQNKIQAAVTVTEMDVYPAGPAHTATAAQTLIRVIWTRTLSSELNAPVRTSGATTLTLQRQRNGNWLVSDSGFSAPN